MEYAPASRKDVLHAPAPQCENVGDEPAVTAPPHGLGAHDGDPLHASERFELLEPSGELCGTQMVGVAAKAGLGPSPVGRLGLRAPAATELGEVAVEHYLLLERLRQGVVPEVRMAS